jgi:single-strand DNA-binding protein
MLELNKVFLIGNLTQDPEVRSLSSGTPVAEIRIAVNRRYKDRDGQPQEDTLFIQVESWNRLADFCKDWLKKGQRVFVEGRLKMDAWEGKDGVKRSRIKVQADRIQFADARPVERTAEESASGGDIGPSASASGGEQGPQPPAGRPQADKGEPIATDDDLPF